MKTSYREPDFAYAAAMQKLRNEIGLTQAGLADRLGVSWRTVAGWEAGSSYPRTEHLKELIALAVEQQAFAVGHEAEEIRVLWKVAHQKMLLDEHWLSALLDQRDDPQRQALSRVVQEPVEEIVTTTPLSEQKQIHEPLPKADTIGDPSPLPDKSLPQTPSKTNADRPRRKLLVGILIALIIGTIIGSAGTLFFQAEWQASKTATDQTYPSYLSGSGTLAFFDPLSQEGRWHSNSDVATGGLCQFTGGAYHVRQVNIDYFGWCRADGIYGNFAFEVQLAIAQGGCAGMVFRDDSNGHFYKFIICQDSVFVMRRYTSNNISVLLQNGNSSAIRTGLGQQNKIAVVASSSMLTFYVNERQIDQEQDSSPTPGKIALIADTSVPDGGLPTEVAYSNARLWAL